MFNGLLIIIDKLQQLIHITLYKKCLEIKHRYVLALSTANNIQVKGVTSKMKYP